MIKVPDFQNFFIVYNAYTKGNICINHIFIIHFKKRYYKITIYLINNNSSFTRNKYINI